ncbi:MAG: SIR2 family protein [Deltaproteobacteria bacterium]|nr:SIR2 family protein [Deltaproteobacteria bacterium]
MKFVRGGPDIPYEVLIAQEDERLVLFCGAGVSIKAGLPDFKKLIDGVYAECGEAGPEPNSEEERAFDAKAYGLVIDLLEERLGSQQFRESVRKIILRVPFIPDLSVHSAILQLSANHKGQQKRVVTTNFDLLFEKAGSNLISYSAPALPVPKLDRWTGIVHLHGRINSDHQERDLVLTSADFGTAYMSEGWASRFVVELFRNYTVLFIGYGINDPVMRYLLDALEADRKWRGENQNAYAFVENDKKSEWASKKVVPIFYDSSGYHYLLHETLEAWSSQWSGGRLSKISTMRQLAIGDPQAMQNHEKNNLIELLQDPKVANKFAEMGKQTNFSWCEEFDKAGILNTPGGTENALVRGYYSPDMVQPFDRRKNALAALSYWVLEHMENPDAVRWVVKKGHILHEELKSRLWLRLNNSTMPEPLQVAWSVLAGAVPLHNDENRETYYLYLGNRIGSESWSPKLRTEILTAFSPCLKIEPPSGFGLVKLFPEFAKEQEKLTVGSLFRSRCVLRCGDRAIRIYEKLVGRGDWPAIALDCAFGFTELLRRAMDMQAIVHLASETYDVSSMEIEHISKIPRDKILDSNSWMILVWLLWRAFKCVRAESLETANILVDTWQTHHYPVFRRLILAALSQGTEEDANR